MDEITLMLPRERPFIGVANLVLGGLASRLSVTVETLEDLQIALESLLERDSSQGEVTLALRVRPDAIEALIGPFGDAVRTELDSEPGSDVGLRRILDTIADSVRVGDRGGAVWVELTKGLSRRDDSGGG